MRRPKVLIVDAALVVRSLRRLLRARFEIVQASRAEDAAALLLESDDFDALVFDVDTPLERAVYGAFVADPTLAPRIVFTTTARDPETEPFLVASGRPWLTKPFETEALSRELTAVIASPRNAAKPDRDPGDEG